MLDLITALAAALAVVVIGACMAVMSRLARMRDMVVREIAGIRREVTNIQSINRSHGSRLDRLDRSRSFSAEQEARVSSIERRCQMSQGCVADRRVSGGVVG